MELSCSNTKKFQETETPNFLAVMLKNFRKKIPYISGNGSPK